MRSAAAKLEINEQTIYRRKRDPEFMQKYNEARRERTEAARNVLQERAHAAAVQKAAAGQFHGKVQAHLAAPLGPIRWQRSCRMQTRPHRPA